MSAWDGFSVDDVGVETSGDRPPASDAPEALAGAPLWRESNFYGRYRWCLDASPKVQDLKERLLQEVARLAEGPGGWERGEVMTNVFLLACALADTTDDYLAGTCYDFSRAAAVVPGIRPIASAVQGLAETRRRLRARRLAWLYRWRDLWDAAVAAFLQQSLVGRRSDPVALSRALGRLSELTARDLPPALLSRRVRIPSAFRTQDLTHHDILELTDRFASAFPDRERALMVVGLRTAGSYFAPLVRASLASHGFRNVEAVTLRPKEGFTPWERSVLSRGAARHALALVVDEPADTGDTLARVVDVLRNASVPPGCIVALLPIHPTRRDWRSGYESLPVADVHVRTLAPEDSFKHGRLENEAVELHLQSYFRARGYSQAAVAPGSAAERFNRHLQDLSEEKFHSRLKRVYEVRLQRSDGRAESRYVLAKSVGWGWLGYHAFLAAEALSDFVPPLLGLRDGILYTEWLPQADPPALPRDREQLAIRAASYVAARVRSLRLPADPAPELDSHRQRGAEMLAGALSGAYGWKPVAALRRTGICRELTRRACPVPTLIDGKMRLQEWIRRSASFVKTDFEHHGMGKTELNVTDPAYDLAEAILHLGLSLSQEEELLRRYRDASGDGEVGERLFPHKLLAGTAAINAAFGNLRDPRLRSRHHEFNQQYIDASEFLTTQTVRFCGQLCRRPRSPAEGSPLVVLDIDGVLDKQVFGFPSTTAAGIEALSLLHAHGLAVALNSARTLNDLQEYSRAYGCSGGVAEYGSVVWDAATGRTQVLVPAESRGQMDRLARALRRIPGVFLNERYQHSLRGYSYDRNRTVPLPSGLVQGLIADHDLNRLRVHQTYVDTTVLAAEVDKGKGLLALLALAGMEGAETVAIGDSEPDLPMFRVASRSFAPRHISARTVALRLGCRITGRSYQPGLLSAVRAIVHPQGGRCERCEGCRPTADGLFWRLLNAADRTRLGSLLRALADPLALQAFLR
jgi:hydroxymethylpyrimidine pyrophosphatase-like HAD family hydrolase